MDNATDLPGVRILKVFFFFEVKLIQILLNTQKMIMPVIIIIIIIIIIMLTGHS